MSMQYKHGKLVIGPKPLSKNSKLNFLRNRVRHNRLIPGPPRPEPIVFDPYSPPPLDFYKTRESKSKKIRSIKKAPSIYENLINLPDSAYKKLASTVSSEHYDANSIYNQLDPAQSRYVKKEPAPEEVVEKVVEKPEEKPEEVQPITLRWFNDSYLLSEWVDRQLKKQNPNIDDVIEVVYRHLGAGKAEVYYTLVNNLFKLNEHTKGWAAYEKMLKVKKVPTPQMFTILFSNLAYRAFQPNTSLQKKEKLFEQAVQLWGEMELENPSIIHMNAFLRVCHACADVGGWDKAWDLFFELQDPNVHNLPKPDLITFNTLLLLCADNRSEDGYNATLDVWKYFMTCLKSSGPNGRSTVASDSRAQKKQLVVDERIIMPVLLACIRSNDIEKAKFSLEIIGNWLNLPTDITEPEANKNKNRMINPAKLSSRTLDILIRISNRIKDFELGKLWINILTVENSIPIDQITRRSLMNFYTQGNMFDEALEQLSLLDSLSPSDNIMETALICAAAASHYLRQGRYEGMDHLKYVRILARLIEPLVKNKDSKPEESIFINVPTFRSILFVFVNSREHIDWVYELFKVYEKYLWGAFIDKLQVLLGKPKKSSSSSAPEKKEKEKVFFSKKGYNPEKYKDKTPKLQHQNLDSYQYKSLKDKEKMEKYGRYILEKRWDDISIEGFKVNTYIVVQLETFVLINRLLKIHRESFQEGAKEWEQIDFYLSKFAEVSRRWEKLFGLQNTKIRIPGPRKPRPGANDVIPGEEVETEEFVLVKKNWIDHKEFIEMKQKSGLNI